MKKIHARYLFCFLLCLFSFGFTFAQTNTIQVAVTPITKPGFWSSYSLEKSTVERLHLAALHLKIGLDIRFVPDIPAADGHSPYALTISGGTVDDRLAIDFRRNPSFPITNKRLLAMLHGDNYVYVKPDSASNVITFVVLYVMVEHFIQKGMHAKAKQILQVLLVNKNALRDTIAAIPQVVADAHFDYATLLQAKHPRLAESLYQKCLTIYPSHADAMFKLAELHRDNSQIRLAQPLFERVLSLDEPEIDSEFELGNIRLGEKDHDTAQQHFVIALAFIKRNREILDWLQGQNNQQKQQRIKAAVLDKKASLIHTSLGKSLFLQQKFNLAKQQFNLALQLKTDNKEAKSYLQKITL